LSLEEENVTETSRIEKEDTKTDVEVVNLRVSSRKSKRKVKFSKKNEEEKVEDKFENLQIFKVKRQVKINIDQDKKENVELEDLDVSENVTSEEKIKVDDGEEKKDRFGYLFGERVRFNDLKTN